MLTAQIEGDGAEGAAVSTEVAKLQVFNRTVSKVSSFVTTYKLYIRMKMRETAVKKQI